MIYIFLANGFEELEAVAPGDILKRGGFEVKTVGVGGDLITSAYGLKIKTDIEIKDISKDNLECIIFPGGLPGIVNLIKNEEVMELISFCMEKNILIGMICAAPAILGKLGLLKDKEACCYPGFEKHLKGAIISKKPVCIDENIITSKGAGIALNFGFELLKYLKGEKAVRKVKGDMQYI